MEFFQLLQGLIERDVINVWRRRMAVVLAQFDSLKAPFAFFRSFGAGVINQDAAHQPRGDDIEMLAVLDLDRSILIRTVEQTQVGFVNQRGRLQRVIGSLL